MRLRRLASPVSLIAIGVLVVGGTGTAVAATGGTFILGRSNAASSTTVLTNSAGTALKLVSKSGTPPLAVGNNVRVPYLNADLLDGIDSSALQRRVTGTCATGTAVRAVGSGGTVTCTALTVRTLLVSPVGTALQNGAKLVAAAGSVTGTATSPWLLQVEPGVYDLGTAVLTLKSYVSLAGAGRTATTLQSQWRGDYQTGAAVLLGSGSEARGFGLELNGSVGTTDVAGVRFASGDSRLTDVDIRTTATGVSSLVAAVAPSGSNAIAENVSVSVDGGTSSAAVGLYALGGSTVAWRGGVIAASSATSALTVFVNGGIVSVVDAQLKGDGSYVVGGAAMCFGDYNAALVAVSSTCDPVA